MTNNKELIERIKQYEKDFYYEWTRCISDIPQCSALFDDIRQALASPEAPMKLWRKYPDEKPEKDKGHLICKERVLRYLGTDLGHRKELRIVSYNFDEFNYASIDIAAWCYESELIASILTAEAQSEKPFNPQLPDAERLEINNAALELAFEAGKWEGQVELEEHFDREQYSQVIPEVFAAKKTAMPNDFASTGRTVRINLRSNEWRAGVRKSAKEYLDKAKILVTQSPAPLPYNKEVGELVGALEYIANHDNWIKGEINSEGKPAWQWNHELSIIDFAKKALTTQPPATGDDMVEKLKELKKSLLKRCSLTKPDNIEHKAALHNLKLVGEIQAAMEGK